MKVNRLPSGIREVMFRGYRIRLIGLAQFLVESASRPDDWHAVDAGRRPASCTCEDATIRKRSCPHTRLIAELLAGASGKKKR